MVLMAEPRRQPRPYASILKDHLARYRYMAFLTGPRQVGKTTTCRGLDEAETA
jgi:predicted AAA+ superfamily ATPase